MDFFALFAPLAQEQVGMEGKITTAKTSSTESTMNFEKLLNGYCSERTTDIETKTDTENSLPKQEEKKLKEVMPWLAEGARSVPFQIVNSTEIEEEILQVSEIESEISSSHIPSDMFNRVQENTNLKVDLDTEVVAKLGSQNVVRNENENVENKFSPSDILGEPEYMEKTERFVLFEERLPAQTKNSWNNLLQNTQVTPARDLEPSLGRPKIDLKMEQDDVVIRPPARDLEPSLGRPKIDLKMEQDDGVIRPPARDLEPSLGRPEVDLKMEQDDVVVRPSARDLEPSLGRPKIDLKMEQDDGVIRPPARDLEPSLGRPEVDLKMEQDDVVVRPPARDLEPSLGRPEVDLKIEQDDVVIKPPARDLKPSLSRLETNLKLESENTLLDEAESLMSHNSPMREMPVETREIPKFVDMEDTLVEVKETPKMKLGISLTNEIQISQDLQEEVKYLTEESEVVTETEEVISTYKEQTQNQVNKKLAPRDPLREKPDRVMGEVSFSAEPRVFETIVDNIEQEIQVRKVLDFEDRQNLMPKLVESIKTLVHEERTEVRIMLKPDHLGELKIRLSTERGIMMAEFIVQNEAVREIIASQLPQLHTALQEQGTQMADVMVNIAFGHKEQESEREQRSQQSTQSRQVNSKVRGTLGSNSEKAYLGRTIWNQVDVRA